MVPLRWAKMAFLILPLIAAAAFLGVICRQMGAANPLFLLPTRSLGLLLLRLLLAIGGMTVAVGVVAALFRPLGLACCAFVLAGLVLLLSWGFSIHAVVLTALVVLVAATYAALVQKDLSTRTNFAVSALSRGQFGLLMCLLAVAVATFFISYREYVSEHGLAIPETYASAFSERLSTRVANALPQLVREQVRSALQEHAERLVTEELAKLARPVERYVPGAAALVLFLPLLAVVDLLSWVPMLALWVLFALLRLLRITRLVRANLEVERLVIA